ncbi:DUF4199 domain-containing protein [Maribacter sp. 2308TA10-17]|uniref:DUF4199 domain-containing protein n=1 Tax=Maribacter sp. 2308TA10-17 TaxID=3386276 RepID=UPI0039BCE6FB
MEENQPKIGKFSWTYGLLLGGVSVIFSLMLYSMDLHYEQGWDIRSIGIALTIAAIVFGMIQFKKANGGYLTIVQGLKLGAGIALISGILGLIWYALLSNVIEPDFFDKSMEIAKVKVLEENPKMTDEQWNQGVEMQKKFAWMAYPIILIINIITGLVIGLIASLFLKKQNPQD